MRPVCLQFHDQSQFESLASFIACTYWLLRSHKVVCLEKRDVSLSTPRTSTVSIRVIPILGLVFGGFTVTPSPTTLLAVCVVIVSRLAWGMPLLVAQVLWVLFLVATVRCLRHGSDLIQISLLIQFLRKTHHGQHLSNIVTIGGLGGWLIEQRGDSNLSEPEKIQRLIVELSRSRRKTQMKYPASCMRLDCESYSKRICMNQLRPP